MYVSPISLPLVSILPLLNCYCMPLIAVSLTYSLPVLARVVVRILVVEQTAVTDCITVNNRVCSEV